MRLKVLQELFSKINKILIKNITEIKEKKFDFYKKIRTLNKIFFELIIIILFFPISIIFYFLNFFIKIRVGVIKNEVIGHYVFDTEFYLSNRKYYNLKSLDFFFNSKYTSNIFFDKIVKRNFKIFNFFKYVFISSNFFFKKNIVVLNEITNRDIYNIMEKTEINLKLSDTEIKEGNLFLNKIGIKSQKKYVCLICRDEVYKNLYLKDFKKNWSYHDYRNSDIKTYLKAVEYLINEGYFVIRMGKGSKGKLNINDKNYYDYSNSEYRSDFLDIFLFANCYFCLGSEAGIITSTYAYRRPLCFVNQATVGDFYSWSINNVHTFKKYYSTKYKRYLSFKEIFNKKLDRLLRSEFYLDNNIELINNSIDEIYEATKEMNERLLGKWTINKDEIYLQNKFRQIFPVKNGLHNKILAKVSYFYLKNNSFLLN